MAAVPSRRARAPAARRTATGRRPATARRRCAGRPGWPPRCRGRGGSRAGAGRCPRRCPPRSGRRRRRRRARRGPGGRAGRAGRRRRRAASAWSPGGRRADPRRPRTNAPVQMETSAGARAVRRSRSASSAGTRAVGHGRRPVEPGRTTVCAVVEDRGVVLRAAASSRPRCAPAAVQAGHPHPVELAAVGVGGAAEELVGEAHLVGHRLGQGEDDDLVASAGLIAAMAGSLHMLAARPLARPRPSVMLSGVTVPRPAAHVPDPPRLVGGRGDLPGAGRRGRLPRGARAC